MWPELPYERWSDTCTTLHLWTQIVGKVRLSQTPWLNHSWHVTLYVTARGLTTSPIPCPAGAFQIDFDFIDHRLVILVSDSRRAELPLAPQSVATFYRRLVEELERLGIGASIHALPNEVEPAIPFEQDEAHNAYDAEYATRYWRVLVHADRVMKEFRARFTGKSSPVHYFWGGADMAVTRFSGRPAPPHPGGIPHLPDWITREAYSQEVSSCGFWPGSAMFPHASFYAYAYPEPGGFAQARVAPAAAYYHPDLREFILRYDDVRTASSPDAAVLDFFQSTYEAAATLGKWDRHLLEYHRPPGR
jgi:hypothetical protein